MEARPLFLRLTFPRLKLRYGNKENNVDNNKMRGGRDFFLILARSQAQRKKNYRVREGGKGGYLFSNVLAHNVLLICFHARVYIPGVWRGNWI
jgi:hypothetical protein